MARHILFGSLLILVTSLVHSGVTVALMRMLHHRRAEYWAHHSTGGRVALIGALVVVLFLATLLEVAIWAWSYASLEALPDFMTALYFSMVTYTTLGYGDVLLDPQWRLLASFQAANGVMMFGWTTALLVTAIQRYVSYVYPDD